jgi:diadenylate cyclase
LLQDIITFFSHYIRFIRIADVIDIAIVAYVIYKAVKLIRETRAEQLIKGIVILLVATQLSGWLRLNVINSILRNTMQVGAVALLVVFQPELRRALEKMGRSKFSNLFNFDEYNTESDIVEVIDEIVKSVRIMTQSRIGSLIVIERNTKIGDIIRTGIVLDASVSSELIVNIFMPGTPLHDGAIVIRGDKIKAAGCFLPLTQNQDLSKEIGTRHRAALGISENSDAVVIVVSEETGRISFALNGDLTRNLTVETLRKALTKTLQTDNEKKNVKKFLSWKG